MVSRSVGRKREVLRKRLEKHERAQRELNEELADEASRLKAALDAKRTRVLILLGAQVVHECQGDEILLRRLERSAEGFHKKRSDRVVLGLAGADPAEGAVTSVFEKIRLTGDPVAELEAFTGPALLEGFREPRQTAPMLHQSAAAEAATSSPKVAAGVAMPAVGVVGAVGASVGVLNQAPKAATKPMAAPSPQGAAAASNGAGASSAAVSRGAS